MAEQLNNGRRLSARRRLALLLLVLLVGLAHLGLAGWMADRLRLGWGATRDVPQRLQVAFVRELAPAAPPAVTAVTAAPPPPKPARRPWAARPAAPPSSQADAAEPASAASAAEPAASEPEPGAPPESLPVPEPPPPQAAASEAPAAAEPPAEAASAPAPPAFDWPPSTQLRYRLTGNYRGEVSGSAQVEWVRIDERYQVHLDVVVGLSFAPLFARRMSSDGTLGPDGLTPRRYDEETRRAFADPRRATLRFEPDSIVLANGQRRPRWLGVQDAASQFVQMTWLFTTQPQRLQVGQTIEIPLALPRGVEPWLYDVVGTETLYPDFGPLETFHVKPRREARPGGNLTAEIWFAPSLQYLPVRIRIHQDAETFIDLVIEKPPLQAAPR